MESNDQIVKTVAFKKALPLRSPLFKLLTKNNLSIMEELIKANRYKNMEEELKITNNKLKVAQIEQT